MLNPHSEVLLNISMTSSTCGVHRAVSAEIVQHRVVNGDEARDRSSVQSICGSRKGYLYDIVNTCRLGEGQRGMPPKLTAPWDKHFGDTYEDG